VLDDVSQFPALDRAICVPTRRHPGLNLQIFYFQLLGAMTETDEQP
jgi:hypothetical protein